MPYKRLLTFQSSKVQKWLFWSALDVYTIFIACLAFWLNRAVSSHSYWALGSMLNVTVAVVHSLLTNMDRVVPHSRLSKNIYTTGNSMTPIPPTVFSTCLLKYWSSCCSLWAWQCKPSRCAANTWWMSTVLTTVSSWPDRHLLPLHGFHRYCMMWPTRRQSIFKMSLLNNMNCLSCHLSHSIKLSLQSQ